MKRPTKPRNLRLTTTKDRHKQHVIKSVVKRRHRVSLRGLGRTLVRVAKVLILAAFVGGVYWGSTEGYRRLFWENPDYSLKDVKFLTNGSLTKDQAMSTAGFELGKNIFSYELDAARTKIAAIPQVSTVELRRYLPSRIEVTVTERKPVAWVAEKVAESFATAERSRMVDAGGVVFQPRRNMPEYRSLPVICGFDADDIKPGSTVRSVEMETSLDLLRRAMSAADFRVQVIDLSKGWRLQVTDQKNTRIIFGLDDLDAQLWRLEQVRAEAPRYGQELMSVNVMIERNIPVMFVPPTAPERDIDAELLDESAKSKSLKPVVPKPTARPAAKPVKPSAPPAKKSEPSRSKETPKREGDVPLQPFRRA